MSYVYVINNRISVDFDVRIEVDLHWLFRTKMFMNENYYSSPRSSRQSNLPTFSDEIKKKRVKNVAEKMLNLFKDGIPNTNLKCTKCIILNLKIESSCFMVAITAMEKYSSLHYTILLNTNEFLYVQLD